MKNDTLYCDECSDFIGRQCEKGILIGNIVVVSGKIICMNCGRELEIIDVLGECNKPKAEKSRGDME
jgi:hypothetical protein